MTRMDYQRVILGVIGAAGILTLAVVAPNTLQALPKLGLIKRGYSDRKYYLNRVTGRLEAKGLIKLFKNQQGVVCARLTNGGQARLRQYERHELVIKKPKHWDGKYRVVIFDIKEWKRGVRDELRNWLVDLGFVKLQNSVWVYPYDCEEVVAMLKAHFHLGREVLHLLVDKIENDRWLKREFGLE